MLQGFPLIWPGDLVFDPKWPSFKLDTDSSRQTFWARYHDDCFKNVTSRVLSKSSFDLAWWPSFWLQVTQFQTWPRNQQDKHLSKIHDDCFINVTARVLTRFNTDLARWPSFWPQVTQFGTWPRNHQHKHLEQDSWWLFQNVTTSVNKVLLSWPGDLVFDPKWPSFKLDLELIKANILRKIHDDCFQNVTARVLTRFSFDFAWWPSFWPQVTQFRTWRRNHQDKQFEQDSWWLFKKCDR